MPAKQTNLPDYPSPPGNKPFNIVNVPGPSSYTQVSVATPPTGGQAVTAKNIGMMQIEAAFVMGSDDGTYTAIPFIVANPATGVPSIILEWITADGGAQVAGSTDLSARTVRLLVVGR